MNQNKRDACEKPASAYVHVPFCHGICAYCAFYRQVSQDRSAWLQQICQQIRETDIGHLDTLYFGGGTPSILTEAEFDELRRLFPKDVPEFTLECNPEDVTPQKAAFWRSRGVNRVSMGVQTFDDRRLKAIGRRHTGEQALGAVKTLQEAGITNLSIDLIFGLPGQTLADVQRDVNRFLSLDLPHLSIYSLQIEPDSVFGRRGVQPCDEDLEADMYEWIVRRLKEAGYEHYEISSFAKPGWYSRHNLAYWQDRDFYGFGPGASGREQGERYHMDQAGKRIPDETDAAFEALMMGLRTQFGVDLEAYISRYGTDPRQEHAPVIRKYAPHFQEQDGRLFLGEAGREILNTILVEML
ncbi:radical SAM family heme chaperone HemW [uncultured Faecalibaculum sp.]|uniref:radical SAM family heme chaperone HemW n=1 Tax=uncultured Faecalibaculum sp. TaxID=1729681 RepID=UPI0025E41D81|nr:radical SAM family heme chaperone HemW [uncultured Faecalibaculum sp.]